VAKPRRRSRNPKPRLCQDETISSSTEPYRWPLGIVRGARLPSIADVPISEVTMDRLAGKVAIITGAGSGMGRATAVGLAREGASVIAADLNEGALQDLAAEVGDGLLTQRCDVSRAADVKALVDTAEDRFGGLHAMLNCAGVLRAASVVDTTDEDMDFMIGVNVKGVMYGCKYSIPALQRAGGGSIVNWGSINSMVAEPNLGAYSATKGAVLMITRTVAIEYAKDKIRANCICPGAVLTPMNESYFSGQDPEQFAKLNEYQPLGMGTPEQIANVAVFLASDESSLMSGAAVPVDGACTAQ